MKLAPGQTASPHLIGTYNRNNCTSGAEMLFQETPEFFLSHASSDNFSTGSHSIPWSLTTCCLSSLQPVFGRWLLIPQTSQNKHTPFHSMAWQCASHCQGVQKNWLPGLGWVRLVQRANFLKRRKLPWAMLPRNHKPHPPSRCVHLSEAHVTDGERSSNQEWGQVLRGESFGGGNLLVQ